MAQTSAIVDKLLTNVSSQVNFEGYICEKLFPFIGVKQKTGKLAKYGLSHLRIEQSFMGGRGKARRVEANVRTTTGYDIESHGLEGLVTKDDYRNVELPFKAEEDEVLGITSILLTEKEKVLADTLSSTAILTQNTTLSGTDQLSDYDNSDPMAVFSAARVAIRAGGGMVPNVAWMDWAVMNKIRFHPQLLDFLGFKFDRPGGLTDVELAAALGVRKVLIADAMYNSAKEGQTDALASIWGKHIWFGVLPEKAGVRQTSLGYHLGYEGEANRKVTKWAVNNPSGATAILVEDEYDYLISNAAAAYLIKDAIA